MTAKKEKLINQFNKLKENLSLILLVPTALGGIWQLLELSSISTSFIRFFSISQLVSDGLLILFLLTIFYISFKVGLNIYGKNPFEIDLNRKPLLIWTSIVVIISSSLMFYIGMLPIFENIYKTKNIQIGEIAIIIPGLMMTVGGFIIGIWEFVIIVICKNKDKLYKIYSNLKNRKNLKQNTISILSVITLGIVLFSIKFMLVDLNPYTKNFRQYLLFPENLENREILDLKIISKHKLKYKPVLIYNNDKYFFYRINKNGKNKTLIINFTELIE